MASNQAIGAEAPADPNPTPASDAAAQDGAPGSRDAAAAGARYTVVSPVRHDGTTYAPGSDIVLDSATAGALLTLGAIRE